MTIASGLIKAIAGGSATLTKDGALSALQGLSGIDFAAAYTAATTGDVVGDLNTAEEVLAIASDFFPELKIGEIVVMAAIFAYRAEQAGLWHSGAPVSVNGPPNSSSNKEPG